MTDNAPLNDLSVLFEEGQPPVRIAYEPEVTLYLSPGTYRIGMKEPQFHRSPEDILGLNIGGTRITTNT